jgi:hypothetical protein
MLPRAQARCTADEKCSAQQCVAQHGQCRTDQIGRRRVDEIDDVCARGQRQRREHVIGAVQGHRAPIDRGTDAMNAWITLGQPAAAITLTDIIVWWIGTTFGESNLVSFATGLFVGVTAVTVATALVISGVDVLSHRPTRTAQQF